MFVPGMRVTIQGSPDRADPLACYTSTLVFADGTTLDRYGQRIQATATATGRRAAGLANGEPNLSDEWAVEQRVMTDPKGRDGTLVPLSQVGEFEPGAVPDGQREIPGARGTPEAEQGRNPFANPGARSIVGLTAAGQAALEALAAVPRAERSCSEGSIISDWGGESVNRITQRIDTILFQYGRHGRERTVTHGHERASGQHRAELGWPLDRSLGGRCARCRYGRILCPAGLRARHRTARNSKSSSASRSATAR